MEEDAAARRAKGGERDRSPRLRQRSASEPAGPGRGRGRVERGPVSTAGVGVQTGERRMRSVCVCV